jgi:ribosomal RNA assembly protein
MNKRFTNPIEKPNLIEKYEEKEVSKEKEKRKKWEDGGEFTKEDNPYGLSEETTFTVLFPQNREPYLKKCWPIIEKILKDVTLKAVLDAKSGNMKVSTTEETYDPFIIIKGRDLMRLLSRGIGIEQARRVLENDVFSEIIKIKSLVRNQATFEKRRQVK